MAVAGARPLTPSEVQRYSRHIIMPQVGSVGQRKLIDASVLLVGAGGLGSPLAMYFSCRWRRENRYSRFRFSRYNKLT